MSTSPANKYKWVAGPVYSEDWEHEKSPVNWEARGYSGCPVLIDANTLEQVVDAGNGEYFPCSKEFGEHLAHVLNIHDELVSTLQSTLEMLTDYIWEAGQQPHHLLADARDTLAKAKGEKPNVP